MFDGVKVEKEKRWESLFRGRVCMAFTSLGLGIGSTSGKEGDNAGSASQLAFPDVDAPKAACLTVTCAIF
jgi:hypothetical protein